MIRKLFSHSIIYGLATQIGSIAGALALPIITEDLTELDFGIWGVILAYVGSLKALSTMGMGVVLSNAFFKIPNHHKWLWRQIYGFLHLWMVPFTLTVAGILWCIIPEEASHNRTWIIIGLIGPDLFFGPTVTIGTYYYQLDQKPKPIAIRSVVFGIVTVALNVCFISSYKLGYMGWLWSTMIVNLMLASSYWIPLNLKYGYTPIFNFNWRRIKKAMRVGLPTVPHQYSSFLLNSSDRIVLDSLGVGVSELGEYSLAARFSGYFQSMANAANRAVSPMMLSCYKEQREPEARNLVFVTQAIFLLLTSIFCIWSKEIFQLLIRNPKLASMYPLAIVMVMACNYHPSYTGAVNKLFYLEKTSLLWKVSFVAGVGNAVLNLFFIPLFGFQTAAYTTFASLMYMGFSGHYLPSLTTRKSEDYKPTQWLTTILFATFSVYIVKDTSMENKTLIALFFVLLFSAYWTRLRRERSLLRLTRNLGEVT